MRARIPKYAPKIQIFAFYCIFSFQFSKVSEGGPGPHGPHTHEALVFTISFVRASRSVDDDYLVNEMSEGEANAL